MQKSPSAFVCVAYRTVIDSLLENQICADCQDSLFLRLMWRWIRIHESTMNSDNKLVWSHDPQRCTWGHSCEVLMACRRLTRLALRFYFILPLWALRITSVCFYAAETVVIHFTWQSSSKNRVVSVIGPLTLIHVHDVSSDGLFKFFDLKTVKKIRDMGSLTEKYTSLNVTWVYYTFVFLDYLFIYLLSYC